MPPTAWAAEAYAVLFRFCLQAVHQALRFGGELLVETGLRDQLQRRQPGRHRHRAARQGAGLVHRPERGDLLHDVAASAEGAHRHAAADHLAQGGEVGTMP
jgi:hypothetical protein